MYFSLILIVLFAGFGVLFGALNSEMIVLDFYIFNLSLSKGAAILAALLGGWLMGGLVVYLGLVLRLRKRLRLLQRTQSSESREPALTKPPTRHST